MGPSTDTAEIVRDDAQAAMVSKMHLLLSASAMITVLLDPAIQTRFTAVAWLVFFGYTVHSIVLYLLPHVSQQHIYRHSRVANRIDVCWYALMVYQTGGGDSSFFPFFLFVILISAFRWGFDEGARITLASALLFSLTVLSAASDTELLHILLRTTFLLALGYMIAYWGESHLMQRRRLALLRDVSRLSNPRFGADHTIASVLECTRDFFQASSAVLVMQESEAARWQLRTARQGEAGAALRAVPVSAALAEHLTAIPARQTLLYVRPPWRRLGRWRACWASEGASGQWRAASADNGAQLAELLEARSFICCPVSLRHGAGQLYVVSEQHDFGRTDAQFLNHIVAQAFSVIENILLLDRLASEAAQRERQKIAIDLHDSTIQHYISLYHTLIALSNKAAPDNPLRGDLRQLASMADKGVGDLRHFAGVTRSAPTACEPVFRQALQRRVAELKQLHGLDLTVDIRNDVDIGDRLAAEVLLLLSEGVSNICKHTTAKHGLVQVACADGRIRIVIENECMGAPRTDFIPRSLTQRGAALGGKTYVERGDSGGTAVRIEIPI